VPQRRKKLSRVLLVESLFCCKTAYVLNKMWFEHTRRFRYCIRQRLYVIAHCCMSILQSMLKVCMQALQGFFYVFQ
jgi:hypothetical protein